MLGIYIGARYLQNPDVQNPKLHSPGPHPFSEPGVRTKNLGSPTESGALG